MAAGEHPLVEQSTVPVVSDVADAASKPHVRPAFFLRPRARDGAAPPAPPGDPGPVPTLPAGIEAEFKGWACVPRRWPEWVDKLRRRHEPQWRELGILGGILASKSRVRRRDHDRALLQLAAFWSRATSTFVLPWGEATLTLEDMHALAGLPLVGVSVREPVSDSLEKDVAAIEAVRAVLNRSKEKKASYGGWVKRFVERAPEEEAPPSAAGGDADREARELVEHGAFLSMWLSLFVLPGPPHDVVRREVLPLAARLARGQRVALAPAALASIYHDLSELKRHITSGKKKEPLVVSAPAHILQLWIWEHFTQLSPEPAASSAQGDHDMPRATRWHGVGKTLSSKHVDAVFMSPKQFKWRPYGNSSLFGLQPEMGRFWSTATSEELLSLRRCLHACELVGMNCIQQYSPHRVARQLGFDQDIPGMVPRASSGWEKAWETFNKDAEGPPFIFPNYMPGVTVQYAKWWKPFSSACGSSVGNAAKMKERHGFDRPAKRKMEGVLAGNSGKKIRLPVATTRGRQPNIPPGGTNVYPSQSSGNHAAMRQAMPATGMPQPPPDEAYDPEDHISLSERLNSIIEMPKQHNTECLVVSDDDECDKSSSKGHEVSAMHLKSHMPGAKMSIIGERNEDTKLVDARNNEQDSQVLKKVTKQGNFNDIVEISDDELDGKTRPLIGERNEDTNLVDARKDEQDSHVLKKVTKQGNFNDIVEISDDELDEQTNKKAGMFVEATSKEDVLDTMRLKSPEMEPTLTILQECNEEKQMVRETNDDQDNTVMKEGTVQNNYDHQLASVQDDTTPRRQPDILTHPATVETNDGLLQGPAEEMDACIVPGDIGNIDKVPNVNGGSLNFSEKGNEDILAADQESEHPMEHSAGTSINKSGNSERLSSRLLDGNTKLDQEVCTKTLYYLSRFDRMKDAWEKDANTLPKRAVGTMDMIRKASAIRQAEMAELKKKINTLKKEIRALEAA